MTEFQLELGKLERGRTRTRKNRGSSLVAEDVQWDIFS